MKKSFAENNDASYKQYDTDSGDNLLHKRRPEATKVIQCPECQTTFAVQSATLEGITHPRFHCSRCDHVFSFEISSSTAESIESENLAAQTEEETTNNTFIDNNSTASSEHNNEHSPVFDYDISFQDQDEIPSHGWTIGDALAKSVSAIAKQQTKVDDFPEPTSSNNLAKLINAPEAPVTKPETLALRNFSNWSENSLAIGTSCNTTILEPDVQMDLLLNPGFRRKKQADFDHHNLSFNKFRSINSNASEQETRETSFVEAPSIPKTTVTNPPEKHIDSLKAKKTKAAKDNQRQLKLWDSTGKSWAALAANLKEIVGWRSLYLVLAPILLCLVVLSIASYFLTFSPKTALAIGSALSSDIPAVAPDSLELTNGTHKLLALESGETVHLLTGAVSNFGDTKYDEILIQGILFDRSGRILNSQIVPLANSLTRARVSSLSWDMIDKLQSTPQAKRFLLEPGQTSNFALAINSKYARAASHMSLRIYSVK